MKKLTLVSCLSVLFLSAQAQPDETSEPKPAVSWNDTDQTISVEQTVSDQAIEKRLSRIIELSGRVDEPTVKVTEGVVEINGQVSQEEHIEWATAAAMRTEGVIAVVNNLTVPAAEKWDLDPAVSEAMSLYDRMIKALPKITIALIVLVLTWLLAKLAIGIGTRVLNNRLNNAFVRRLSARMFALPVIVIGIYLVLQLTGLTSLAMTVLGGTGLLGLIIGIAFKDIAENFLASILISIQRPFKIGDYIEVDGHAGVVHSVTTRGTVIMTLEGNHIHIPNSTIYKNTIVNVTANPKIRLQFTVGIGYDDSIHGAQQIALEVVLGHPAVLADPEPQVLVDNLGAATINLEVYFWVDGQKNSTSKVKSAVIRLVKKAFDDANISMPDEAREVVFPDGIQIKQVSDADSTTDQTNNKPAKPDEPESSAIEDDLSNEVDEIRKQSAASQLTEEQDNLIDDQH